MSKQEWLDYRLTGIGASEIASVMRLSPYLSAAELFYQKIGIFPNKSIDNVATHWGKVLESVVADQWQYWGGSEQTLIDNVNTDTVVRRCQRVNAYVRNPEFDHLFVSLDRLILPKYNNGKEGALEIKTISGFASNQWDAGIPIYYVVQLQTQLLVTGMEYGELAMLKDGRYLDVIPFEYAPDLCQSIMEMSKEFWYGRVIPAKKIVELLTKTGASEDEIILAVQEYEPEPDATPAYEAFLAKKHKSPDADLSVEGEAVHYQMAVEVQKAKGKIKEIEEGISIRENTIKSAMGNAQTMDFGNAGKITWNTNKKGVRTFKINLK